MYKRKFMSLSFIALLIVSIVLFAIACSDEDNTLASYTGSPEMSKVRIENGTFKPNITWVGGYVSVIGVNRGSSAKLDSSLVWLIKVDGNQLQYPILFGTTPSGAQELTSNYGGALLEELKEDDTYTYWVMKEETWNNVKNQTGIPFEFSSELKAGEFIVEADTLLQVSSLSYSKTTQQIDVYVNVADLKFFGKLGEINVSQPVDEQGPEITWTIIQSDVTESAISAIGIIEGQQYDEKKIVWDLWSVEPSDAGDLLGKKNVINMPLRLGDQPSGTKTFNQYPEEGIQRNKDYYIWIANEDWDGKRFRVTKYYAYATFRTW
ncbi:MAG: hypothetical protein JW995_12585 [Melioribacteraceae bacterium]|nr:hypothetical protein [Melioribacteraceae bacterium]